MLSKTKGLALAGLFTLSTTFAATNASAFLLDWGIDPDGGGDSIINVPEYLDITGTASITNDFTTGTFTEVGTFTSFSVGPGAIPLTPNLYATFTASGQLGTEAFTFDYVVDSLNLYEEDQSTLIGTFDLLSGGGELDPDGSFGPAPNGDITANFQASYLETGYWFHPDGSDLSATDPITLILGFATVNGSVVTGSEQYLIPDDANSPLVQFDVGNNGQFRLNEVPEPATFALFGVGLLGLAGYARKKK